MLGGDIRVVAVGIRMWNGGFGYIDLSGAVHLFCVGSWLVDARCSGDDFIWSQRDHAVHQTIGSAFFQIR